jgi:hypothetical protein
VAIRAAVASPGSTPSVASTRPLTAFRSSAVRPRRSAPGSARPATAAKKASAGSGARRTASPMAQASFVGRRSAATLAASSLRLSAFSCLTSAARAATKPLGGWA